MKSPECFPLLQGNSPEEVLLDCLVRRDLVNFSKVLTNTEEIDLNKRFPGTDVGYRCTLLEYACENGLVQFVEQIVPYTETASVVSQSLPHSKIVDLDLWNPAEEQRPIHAAAKGGCKEVLQLLISHGANPTSKNKLGKTPLHLCAKKGHTSCLETLLANEKVKIDEPDKKGCTALYDAALTKAKDAAWFLVTHGANLEKKNDMEETPLEVIEDTMPEMLKKIKKERDSYIEMAKHHSARNLELEMLRCLKEVDIDGFREILKEKPDVNARDINETCLHVACRMGETAFIELLLEHHADSSSLNETNLYTPAHCAAALGHIDVMKILAKYHTDFRLANNSGQTPLHLLIKNSSSVTTDDLECLIRNGKVDLDIRDSMGNTVLHYAAFRGAENIIMSLLNHGANLFLTNNFGEMPAERIAEDTLGKFFDSKISGKSDDSFKEYILTFDYNCFSCSKGEAETSSLWRLSQHKSHLKLLTHPLIKSFLHLKWSTCSTYYMANAIFYTVFLIYVSCHFLWLSPLSNNVDVAYAKCILLILNAILTLREMLQLLVSPLRYLTSPENYLEWLMIICFHLASSSSQFSEISRRTFAAVALLAAWMEFVLLLGRSKWFSVSVQMFLQVSGHFIKILSWYFPFVIGFAITFYILFEPTGGDFTNIGTSLMKMFTMMVGELNYGDINMELHPVIGNILFILLLFFITIVLMNLLTGLAVEDTRAIRESATVVGYKRQLELISYIESMFFNEHFNKISPLSWMCSCFQGNSFQNGEKSLDNLRNTLGRRLCLLPSLPSNQAQVRIVELASCFPLSGAPVGTTDQRDLMLSNEIVKEGRVVAESQVTPAERIAELKRIEARKQRILDEDNKLLLKMGEQLERLEMRVDDLLAEVVTVSSFCKGLPSDVMSAHPESRA